MGKFIKVSIDVVSDGDFVLEFPRKMIYAHKIEFDQNDYKIELLFSEKTAKEDLIDFLGSLGIDSRKEYHLGMFNSGITQYKSQLETIGLSSSKEDLLGGGNWSFVVDIERIELL